MTRFGGFFNACITGGHGENQDSTHIPEDTMNALVERLRYSHGNKHLIGKTLSRAVTIATSVGVLAEGGKQFTITERVKDVFVGTIQVGEYILTGEIPSAELVASVLKVGEGYEESAPDECLSAHLECGMEDK